MVGVMVRDDHQVERGERRAERQIDLVERTGDDVHLSTLGTNGIWSPWSSVPTDGHSVRSVAVAPSDGVLHVVELSADGESVGDFDQNSDGTWYGALWVNAAPDPGFTATEVAAAYTGQGLQVATVEVNGYYSTVYHSMRHTDFSWDNFSDVQAVVGYAGNAQHVSITHSEGDLQVAYSTPNGALFHTIRHWDGSWQPVGDVEGLAGNVNAGPLTMAGYYY